MSKIKVLVDWCPMKHLSGLQIAILLYTHIVAMGEGGVFPIFYKSTHSS